MNRLYFGIILVIGFLLLVEGEKKDERDFYELLNVPKNADTKTIRKAFKKLAISMHPDKNQDDPDAHSKFVRINRAYEVLKDEDLRKNYDEHGEDGAQSQQSQQYQSWQFYRDNFGIYDDDIEIVTLSRSDFGEEVTESNDFWFINFYSTFCSHCHVLAPTWREFARKMHGIIRIGAVNCAEDPHLCQSQSVHSYPSLLIYPQRILYQGAREANSLIKFAISKMTTIVHRFDSIEEIGEFSRETNLPIFLEYCDATFDNYDDEEEDDFASNGCLSAMARKKIASMLSDIVNFGVVDCSKKSDKMCREYRTKGFALYPIKQFGKAAEKEIQFGDLKEIYSQILKEIPDLNKIDSRKLNDIFNSKSNSNTLVLFLNNMEDYLEDYKLLPNYFLGIQIYLADCSDSVSECSLMRFEKLPKAVVFRKTGGYDIHYGAKLSLRDVSNFVRKSLTSNVISLNDRNYMDIRKSKDIWLVDYFAPWCPPCLRLIQELRKLPKQINGHNLRVGIISCDAYKVICSQVQIRSFPTSILYLNGNTYNSVGFHSTEQILDFIEESINPSVLHMDYKRFQELVVNRKPGQLALIDFYMSWCGPCQQLAPEFQRLARNFLNENAEMETVQDMPVVFGKVDCDEQRNLCLENGIRSYPAIRLFGIAHKQRPVEYPGNWWRDHKSMRTWLEQHLPSLVEVIKNEFETSVLASEVPTLVDFFAPWCGHCVNYAPIYERVARLLKNESVRVAKVDCNSTPFICQKAQIRAYPSIRFYPGRVNGNQAQNSAGIQFFADPNPQATVNAILELIRTKKQTHSNRISDEL